MKLLTIYLILENCILKEKKKKISPDRNLNLGPLDQLLHTIITKMNCQLLKKRLTVLLIYRALRLNELDYAFFPCWFSLDGQ